MTYSVNPRLLQKFEPLRKLSIESLERISNSTKLYSISPGHSIPIPSPKETLLYLVKGSVRLYTSDVKQLSIVAGDKRSLLPLCTDDDEYDSVRCTEISYLAFIDRESLQQALQTEDMDNELDNIEVDDETELNPSQSDLLIKLYTAYEQESLELPSMPEVALRLRDATRDPDVSIDKLVRIIQADAAIAGSLLHAANGPLFCSAGPVKNLRNAVVRLGVATTQSLATAVGLFKVFYAQNPNLRKRINQTWRDSLTVSGLSYALTKHFRRLDPDRALLAGLLHRVGTISVLGYMDANGLNGTSKEIDSAIDVLNRPVGILVMKYWDMGDDLIKVVEEYDQWDRSVDVADYCDVVQVSWLYHAYTSERGQSLPDLNSVPAAERLGLNPPIEEHFETFKDSAYGITDLAAMT